jgi:hypothetical protein
MITMMSTGTRVQAYRNPYDHSGPLLFSPPHAGLSASANVALSGLKIPCGQCIGCRLEYSRRSKKKRTRMVVRITIRLNRGIAGHRLIRKCI